MREPANLSVQIDRDLAEVDIADCRDGHEVISQWLRAEELGLNDNRL